MNTTKVKFTRKDYLNEKCTHNEYYGQFVTQEVVKMVENIFGADKLKEAFQSDPHLNNIPLIKWDDLAKYLPNSVCLHICAANESNGLSLSDRVCTLKAAAKQLIKA